MGGGSVFINTHYKNIYANDIIKPLISFYKELQNNNFDYIIENINKWKIDKDNQQQYNDYRKIFNDNGSVEPYLFFSLIQSCTNNMMRFNKKYEFNQTFGKRTFNKNTEEKLQEYHKTIKEKNITFTNFTYCEMLDKVLNSKKDIFVYLDPPYLITEAGYNSYWSEKLETSLYGYLDKLNANGNKFIMSNVAEHKDKVNPYMKKIEKYNIIQIQHDYNKVSRGINSTKEIIVKNF